MDARKRAYAGDPYPEAAVKGLRFRGASNDVGSEKSPGGKPGLFYAQPSDRSCEGQATFLNTLPKLSLTGSADSTATFCAIEASSLD